MLANLLRIPIVFFVNFIFIRDIYGEDLCSAKTCRYDLEECERQENDCPPCLYTISEGDIICLSLINGRCPFPDANPCDPSIEASPHNGSLATIDDMYGDMEDDVASPIPEIPFQTFPSSNGVDVSPHEKSTSQKSSKLEMWQIALIVIAVVIAVAIASLLAYVFMYRKSHHDPRNDHKGDVCLPPPRDYGEGKKKSTRSKETRHKRHGHNGRNTDLDASPRDISRIDIASEIDQYSPNDRYSESSYSDRDHSYGTYNSSSDHNDRSRSNSFSSYATSESSYRESSRYDYGDPIDQSSSIQSSPYGMKRDNDNSHSPRDTDMSGGYIPYVRKYMR